MNEVIGLNYRYYRCWLLAAGMMEKKKRKKAIHSVAYTPLSNHSIQ
jgi:hypothetical protein